MSLAPPDTINGQIPAKSLFGVLTASPLSHVPTSERSMFKDTTLPEMSHLNPLKDPDPLERHDQSWPVTSAASES